MSPKVTCSLYFFRKIVQKGNSELAYNLRRLETAGKTEGLSKFTYSAWENLKLFLPRLPTKWYSFKYELETCFERSSSSRWWITCQITHTDPSLPYKSKLKKLALNVIGLWQSGWPSPICCQLPLMRFPCSSLLLGDITDDRSAPTTDVIFPYPPESTRPCHHLDVSHGRFSYGRPNICLSFPPFMDRAPVHKYSCATFTTDGPRETSKSYLNRRKRLISDHSHAHAWFSNRLEPLYDDHLNLYSIVEWLIPQIY